MYGKIFDSIYKGTLYGQWEAIVTLQQLVTLCDSQGVIDMTPQAIAATTSIPLNIINKGLKVLQDPDPFSRTPGEEGRRIVLIDDHRPWGWFIVNHKKYRDMASYEEKKLADKIRIAEKRKAAKNKGVASCRKLSQAVEKVANVAYTNADTNADTNTDTNTDTDINKTSMSGKPDRTQAKEILNFLNTKTGRRYEPVEANLKLIIARLKEYGPDKLRQMIALKSRKWINDDDMSQYLRPATLFNATKCAQYIGELHG